MENSLHMPETQNYSNHTRWFPLFHFVLMPLLIVNFLCHLIRLFMTPGWEQGFWVLFSIVLMMIPLVARLGAMRVQDRVIRLEELLRYERLLSPEQAKRAEALRLSQIIALRFASDEELPGLVDRTLAGEFKSQKEIKIAVKNWRADHLRV